MCPNHALWASRGPAPCAATPCLTPSWQQLCSAKQPVPALGACTHHSKHTAVCDRRCLGWNWDMGRVQGSWPTVCNLVTAWETNTFLFTCCWQLNIFTLFEAHRDQLLGDSHLHTCVPAPKLSIPLYQRLQTLNLSELRMWGHDWYPAVLCALPWRAWLHLQPLVVWSRREQAKDSHPQLVFSFSS